jgi:hypothetical protein
MNTHPRAFSLLGTLFVLGVLILVAVGFTYREALFRQFRNDNAAVSVAQPTPTPTPTATPTPAPTATPTDSIAVLSPRPQAVGPNGEPLPRSGPALNLALGGSGILLSGGAYYYYSLTSLKRRLKDSSENIEIAE